jgi:multicomponent Na+:H+ antiporter subunit D
VLEHPAAPFLLAAAVVALAPKRVGVAAMLGAPAVALVQLRALGESASTTVEFFGYELQVLRLDDMSTPFAYIFVLAAFLAGLFGATTLTRPERVAALLYAGFGTGVVLAGDLLTLFAVWEMKAVASAVLIAAGGGLVAGRAAFRYLMFHIVGGTLLLGGILWHLSSGGSITFERFGSHTSAALVLVAFLLSAAVPPLHSWLPDAYPAASLAGTVFLSAFTTKAAVYALLRGFSGTEVLVVLGVAMALYGVVYAVLENDVRRLLGYHIVSQVGYMVAAVGIGTAAAVNGATAHAFAHILYKGLLLMGVGALIAATGREKLTELGGLARAMPLVLGLYMVGAFSISGFPLFSGFVSKELVIDAAYGDGREVMVHLLKLASVGTFLHTGLKLPWFAWGGRERGIEVRPIARTMILAMVITAAANVVIGLRPHLLYGLMPYPVDYQPYTAAKLSEVTQLLVFTGIGFWVLVKKLGGESTITLDTDWIYRRGAGRVVTVVERAPAPTTAALSAGLHQVASRTRLAAVAAGAPIRSARPSTPPPTIALGVVTIAAVLVVLGLSLVT